MGKHFSKEFKEMVVNDYKKGECGGHQQIAKKYNIDESTLWHWIVKDRIQGNQDNDIENKRGRTKEENIDYKGFIFIGLMNVDGDPYVIEYNVRLGDPETEGVMTRIDSDLLALLDACAQGKLDEVEYQTSKNTSVTVMLVSGGYPEDYKKGMLMTGLENLSEDCIIAHAGTKMNDDGEIVTSGGRVIAVTAHGKDIEEARAKAYDNVEKIKFTGVNYRHDIGLDLMNLV